MTRTRIKICGMTRIEDARFAVLQGVDALGFIFAIKSPRNVAVNTAREIVAGLPPFVDPVGVFVDGDMQDVVRIVREVGLAIAQLHGKETPDYCRRLAETAAPCKVVKALRVGPESRAGDFAAYDDVVGGFLLDTYVKGQPGGTGQTFDWRVIGSLDLRRPCILAGGLGPDNIAAAIRSVGPWAVDVNSGVEIAPGIKDHAKIRELVAQVKAADTAMEESAQRATTKAPRQPC